MRSIFYRISMFIPIKMIPFLIAGISFSQQTNLPAIESFESSNVLGLYQNYNSTLAISTDHMRLGKSSLKWEWQGESSLGTANFRILSHAESPLRYGNYFPSSPTTAISLYNETPQNDTLTISFEKEGKVAVWFDVPLSFKGWRRIWVPFYEMQGNAPEKGAEVDYDYFRINTSAEKGKLFLDDIVFSQYQDDRHQYPDLLVPFIKADTNLGSDHWMPLISNYERIKNLEVSLISMAVRMDLQKFEKLIDADLRIDKKYKVYIKSLREDFQKLNIKDTGETVIGPPLTFMIKQEYYDEKQHGPLKVNDVSDLGKVLKKLANFHDRADASQKQEIEEMFLTGTKYFLDQGWVAGAAGGTRHHIGYNVRDITEAFFTMRQLLYDNGLLNEIGASLHWLFNLGMLLDDESNFHVNIDYLNTQSYYHLMLIFLMDSQEKQAALLHAYSNYISITLAQQNEEWGFKVDGTAWHHNGHYPAYGYGAFKTVPKVIRTLSGTRFRIKTDGHENFIKAFLNTRAYSQLYDWGFGNAGRHPLEANSIKSLKEEYLLMAYAGNPEGTEKIDKEVAAAYLRLWGKEDKLNSILFREVNGIRPEQLSGYHTMPYAATAIHRRNDWAAIVKGYSKYVWASEIYVDENRYGRYPANGTIQLLNEKGEAGSGFKQEGWDWNRYPGATVIYLPFEELEPKMPLIMFRSNETFVGATELDGNGVFGMILNEGKGSNSEWPETKVGFPGKLYAKKSVFSFGDKLIAIGTNISSIDENNPVQTNLFQSLLIDPKIPLYTSNKTITKFPVKTELASDVKKNNWVVDPYGNGYYILSNTAVQLKKEHQHSYHNKYSINTGRMNAKGKGAKETEADYAAAWIDHGSAPKNANYQYVIYPFLKEEDQKKFEEKAKTDDSYSIIRADSIAHIVSDNKSNTTAYAVFEAKKKLDSGYLTEVSEPSLIMVRKDSDKNITISAVQPDLNFPEYQPNKYRNYSTPVSLTITLEGKWSALSADFLTAIDNSGSQTIISLECKDGFPRVFKMTKLGI
ncbi:chondroitinase family polysaccharide lyase [Arenibacter sp. M-2]|uniref:chondroitinase family polysaccharide lyase n=1 Tax=Arenibacter sp. M-2 TaxID=3053612 RepID=UPI0025702DC7|nr:chondroitinase family polysaccharide lyase [Arenibacter sp. M-2]MDL5513939.1 chondroitinase family polysaccharide lyase [Arenibacter sp. M-2]